MYEVKKFENLIGMSGLSEELFKNHFTLYEGYVKHLNLLIEKIPTKESQEMDELKRRFGWEFNGVRLHELFFGNITKNSIFPEESSTFYQKIAREFGSFEHLLKNIKDSMAIRGIGWVVLYYDQEADNMFVTWVNEHDQGHLVGCKPLLVLDVFEHAYMLDYGTKRADYIEAIVKQIDWEVVGGRI